MTAKSPPVPQPSFNFQDAVYEAYAMHPHIAGRVFFFEGTTNTIHHPAPQMAQWAAGLANADYSISAEIHKHGKDRMSVAAGASSSPGLRYILFYEDNPLEQIYGKKIPASQRHYFTFDHELGHTIVRPGSERAADAYAALRHLQRFGADTESLRSIALFRALGAAGNSNDDSCIDHYTAPVLQAVIKTAARQDVTRLTPLETVRLAEKIVAQTPMKPVSALRKDFQAAFAPYQAVDADAETRVRGLARAVMETQDAEVFNCGSLVLQGLLKGKIVHKANDNETLALDGREWSMLRARFNKKAKDWRRWEKDAKRKRRAAANALNF
jgi:hypothetical protein